MIERLLPAGPQHHVRVRCSDRRDGDFHVDGSIPELTARRQALAPGEWTWLRQVHGPRVLVVDEPGGGAGEQADASVTTLVGAVLAVQTADCVPVVLAAPGALAVAHAGWRGVVEGVIPAAVAAVRERADSTADLVPVYAFVGPHIRAAHYAFGDDDLGQVAAVAGEEVRSVTEAGQSALDMTAAVTAVLEASGVTGIEVADDDTADAAWFSHRIRGDRERQVTVAWIERTGTRRTDTGGAAG